MKGQGGETKETGKGTRHDGRRNKYGREKRKGGESLKYHIMSNPPVWPNHSLLLVSQERKRKHRNLPVPEICCCGMCHRCSRFKHAVSDLQ